MLSPDVASTGVHDSSSRSHAILRIYIQRDVNHLGGYSSIGAVHEGVLTLVDLAGSEHRIDSMHHSADRRKEGAGINASLMALKECIRARAAGLNASHQYRKSKLTMALKASFLAPSARTLIIATVSPASKDTEHTLNTLRHACIMDGQQDIEASSTIKETRFVTGGTIEREECGEVDVTDVARKNMAVKKITGKDASARTSNGNEVQLLESQQPETTERQIAKNRRASERRMFSKLSPEQKILLTAAREKLGSVQRQHERLRRCKVEVVEGNAVGLGAGVKMTALEPSPDIQFSRYGGSGVQSHGILSSSHVKQDARAVEKEGEKEKQARQDKKNLFTKLRSSVYSSAEGVSEALLRRQLVTLMKLNGFTALEISTAIPPCEADDLLEPSPSPSPIPSQGSYPRAFNQSRALENDECLSNAEAAEMQTVASKSIRSGRRQSKLRVTDDENRGLGEAIDTSSRPSKIGSISSINSINDTFVATDSDGTTYNSVLQRTSNPFNEDIRDNEASHKKRVAAANAAAAVESSALTRKSRQEQAKSVRDKLDADKRAALLKKLGRSCDVAPKATYSPRPRTGGAAGAGDGEDSLDAVCASEVSQVASAFTDGNTLTIPALTVHKESPGHPATLDKNRVTDALMREREREREKVVGQKGRGVDRSRISTPHTSNCGQEYERRGSGILRSVPLSALNALNAGTGTGVGAASPRGQAMSSGSRTPTVIVMKGQPVQYFAGNEVEQQVKALQMRGQSSGSTGQSHSSSGDRFNDYHEQARGRGLDVTYRESSSAQSNRPDSYAGENLGRRNREAITTNHNDVGNHEFNARPDIARRMSKTQYDMRDNDHYYQQHQRRTDQYSNDGNDPLNHSQSRQQQRQQQQQQQQLSRSLPRHTDPDPVYSQAQGAHTQGQGAPRQRLSIQEQHKLEYDQNEAYRQAQQQQQQRHLQEQQQQQLIRDQEQEQSRLQQQHQSRRASDLFSPLVRHLRSNPSAQRHVGAAAAPWANELTWDRDMENDTYL